MRLETAQALCNADSDGLELREDYSGRGMYGKTTSGVVFYNQSDLYQAIAMATLQLSQKGDPDELEAFLEDLSFRSDNMGKGSIVY